MDEPWNHETKETLVEEKGARRRTYWAWAFIVCGIIGIILMIATNPRQKRLVCDEGAEHSLTTFGTCQEESP